MQKLVLGSVVLLTLTACGGGRVLTGGGTGLNSEDVCYQQSRWAQVGKVDGGKISITCADGYNAQGNPYTGR